MDRSEQWDLDGICEICRKKGTCQVPCRPHKAREQMLKLLRSGKIEPPRHE